MNGVDVSSVGQVVVAVMFLGAIAAHCEKESNMREANLQKGLTDNDTPETAWWAKGDGIDKALCECADPSCQHPSHKAQYHGEE